MKLIKKTSTKTEKIDIIENARDETSPKLQNVQGLDEYNQVLRNYALITNMIGGGADIGSRRNALYHALNGFPYSKYHNSVFGKTDYQKAVKQQGGKQSSQQTPMIAQSKKRRPKSQTGDLADWKDFEGTADYHHYKEYLEELMGEQQTKNNAEANDRKTTNVSRRRSKRRQSTNGSSDSNEEEDLDRGGSRRNKHAGGSAGKRSYSSSSTFIGGKSSYDPHVAEMMEDGIPVLQWSIIVGLVVLSWFHFRQQQRSVSKKQPLTSFFSRKDHGFDTAKQELMYSNTKKKGGNKKSTTVKGGPKKVNRGKKQSVVGESHKQMSSTVKSSTSTKKSTSPSKKTEKLCDKVRAITLNSNISVDASVNNDKKKKTATKKKQKNAGTKMNNDIIEGCRDSLVRDILTETSASSPAESSASISNFGDNAGKKSKDDTESKKEAYVIEKPTTTTNEVNGNLKVAEEGSREISSDVKPISNSPATHDTALTDGSSSIEEGESENDEEGWVTVGSSGSAQKKSFVTKEKEKPIKPPEDLTAKSPNGKEQEITKESPETSTSEVIVDKVEESVPSPLNAKCSEFLPAKREESNDEPRAVTTSKAKELTQPKGSSSELVDDAALARKLQREEQEFVESSSQVTKSTETDDTNAGWEEVTSSRKKKSNKKPVVKHEGSASEDNKVNAASD